MKIEEMNEMIESKPLNEEPSLLSTYSKRAPSTLANLLDLIDKASGTQDAMLHSVASRFLEFVGRTAGEVSIDLVDSSRPAFVRYLRNVPYARASVKSYTNYMNALIKRAEEAGWVATIVPLPPAWQMVFDLLAEARSRSIVGFAIRQGKMPSNFTEDDLAAWCQEEVGLGRTLRNSRWHCSKFRVAISSPALATLRPIIKVKNEGYGLTLSEMDPLLRLEIEALLDWKTGYRVERSEAAVRPITAKALLTSLRLLTGYVQRIRKQKPHENLASLVTKQNIVDFINWSVGVRKIQASSVGTRLSLIHSALRHDPRHSTLDLSWFPALLNNLPHEKRSRIDDRKDKKRITFAEADQIPARIKALRLRTKGLSPQGAAISVHNELLMLWLVVLPWRQRNIREIRISGDSPNLYLGPMGRFCSATKPDWLEALGKAADSGSFWQVRFSPEETKTKNEVQAFLPSDLIMLLEEYLSKHRAQLIPDGETDPGTLFLNKVGKPLTIHQIETLVGQMTSLHAGVAVNPHLYRDIVAYGWLARHPEDYLTVSKLLWHSSISFTIKVYGSRFDESTGIARMDNWRASLRKVAA